MTDIFLNAVYGTEMAEATKAIEQVDNDIETLDLSKDELKRKIGKIDAEVDKLNRLRSLKITEQNNVLASVINNALSMHTICIKEDGYDTQFFGVVRSVVLGGTPRSPKLDFFFIKVGYYNGKHQMVLDNRNYWQFTTDLGKLQRTIRMANTEECNDLDNLKGGS